MARLRLHEPAVTLSNVVLAVETGAFAIGVARLGRGSAGTARSRDLRWWFIGFFGSSAAASLAGAAVHGLSASKDDPRRLIFWRASLASIGVTSFCAWHLGAALSLRESAFPRFLVPVYVVHLVYLVVVVRTNPPFRLALALQAPGMLFVVLALLSRLQVPTERGPAALALAAGAVSTMAAVIQVRKIALHPHWFDHNATFHATEALAFAILYRAARGLIRAA